MSTVWAAIAGCLLASVAMMLYALLKNGPNGDETVAMGTIFTPILAIFGLYMALPATIVLGIPTTLLLNRYSIRGVWRIVIFAVVGAFAGPIAWNIIGGTKAVGLDRIGAILFGLMCGLACSWTTRRFAPKL